MPILQMGRLKHKKIKSFAWDHTAKKSLWSQTQPVL